MSPPKPLTADLLLEHSGFLHGLARSLVLDEQRAEDVVQEAFAAALRKPPPPRVRLRAWLSTVTRNLALRARRTEGRVRRRETLGAKPESTVATADVAARVEIQQRVAEAVARLDEPGRSAIVWRYFDGLPPREIARRAGVSVRTIESRLRRAREVLRARLDATHGGDRGAWCLALAPVLGLDPSSVLGAAAAQATSTTVGTGLTAAAAMGATLVSTKLILGAAAVCVAGAFFVGREFPAAPVEREASEPAAAAHADGLGPMLHVDAAGAAKRLTDELQGAHEKNAILSAANSALREQLEAARAEVARGEAARAEGADAGRPGVYVPAKYKQVVDKVNWPKAGEAAAKMVALLEDLAAEFVAGKQASQETGIKVFRHNQELQKVAISAIEAKVPGAASNGAFTHPAVIINLIHAALEQAKLPLGDAQLESVRSIGDRYLADDAGRMGGYTEDTFVLQKTIDECALKDGMFAAIDAVLTEEQRNVLHPESVRGRLGIDIYSSGTIWYGVSKAISYNTREELAAGLVTAYRTQVELSEAEVAVLTAAARDWAHGFSAAFEEASKDALGQASQREAAGGMMAGWQRVQQAREAAAHQLALNRALFEAVGEKAAAIRDDNSVFIPLWRSK